MLIQPTQKAARLISPDGSDASRRAIGAADCHPLSVPALTRLAIKRLQRAAVPASKLACTSAADPQRRSPENNMDPVFTLQWPEFVIAQKLQSLLPRKDGYSVLVPLSRQEEGIDLAVLHRGVTDKSETLTIQVKASRTYHPSPPKRKDTVRFRFYTWFNRFDVPDRADFVILFGMYAPDLAKTTRVSADWYKDCSLVFTREEMRQFMSDCKTVGGTPDRMFGFGFNDLSKIILTRGDMNRSGRDFTTYLLENRITELMKK
jgi:hypothetical protein